MAGLGSAMAQQGAPQPAAAPAPAGMDPQQQGALPPGMEPAEPGAEDEQTALPEEQEMYEKIMSNALNIIYPADGDRVSPEVLESLKASEQPLLNVGSTAAAIATGLRVNAQEAGIVQEWDQHADQTPGTLGFDDILFQAGKSLVEELCEVAEAAGIHQFSNEDVENAFYIALDMYREQGKQNGLLDDAVLKAGWEDIVEADQQGRLGELLPGIEQKMQPAPDAGGEEGGMA